MSGNIRSVVWALEGRRWAVAGVLAMVGALIAQSVHGAVIGSIDFGMANDFTDNFRTLTGSSAVDETDGVLRATGSSVVMFDANAAAAGVSTFSTETALADFMSASADGSSFGIWMRVSGDDTSGYLAVVNVQSTDQLRLFKATSGVNAGSAGSELSGAKNTGAVLDGGTFYTLAFTVTNIDSATVQLDASVYEVGGNTPLLSLSITDSSSAFTSAGQIGMRMGPVGTGTVDVDNFRIIPEPASLALLGAGGMLVVGCRRV